MIPTRERIIAATNELFRRQGYNGTSLKQITAASEAPIGSIYHFFPGGKDDLAAVVIESSGAAYQQLFEMIAVAANGPAAMISDLFNGAAQVLQETGFIDPCPIGTVAREVASTNETLRAATERVFDSWIAAAASHFVAAGLPRRRASELATTVIAAIEGGFMLARAGQDADLLRAIGRSVRRMVEAEIATVGRKPAPPVTDPSVLARRHRGKAASPPRRTPGGLD